MDSEKVHTDLVSLKKLYGLLQHCRVEATSPMHFDEKAQILLKDLLSDAGKQILYAYSKLMASPDPADARTKLQRTDSYDISKAFPRSLSKAASNVFTFTTKKKEQSPAGAQKDVSFENPKAPVTVSRPGTSHTRCRVCKRPRITRANSTREIVPVSTIQWPPAGTDSGIQVSPFSVSGVNLKQPGSKSVSSFTDSKSLEGFEVKVSPRTAGSTTVAASPILSAAFYMHKNQNAEAVKRCERADDQILKEVSQMVKLIDSRIATLQVPDQAFNAPSAGSRMTQPSHMNLYSIPKIEADNPFVQTNEKLVEGRMRPSQWDESTQIVNPTSQQSEIFLSSNLRREAENPFLQAKETSVQTTKVVNPTSQQSQIFFNSSPVVRLSISTPSPAPSQNNTPRPSMSTEPGQSHTLTQRQCPAPERTYLPSPGQSPAPKQSSVHVESGTLTQLESPILNRDYIPNQKHGRAPGHRHTPYRRQSCINVVVPEQILSGNDEGHKVKNLVKRLEWLSVSPVGDDQGANPTPIHVNGFSKVSPVPIWSPPEKHNRQRNEKQPHCSQAKDAQHTPSMSASSVYPRNSKPPTELKRNQSGKSTRGAEIPPIKSALIDSKLSRSHKVRSRRYSSDDSNGSSSSSTSVSSSSSWSTTQQSSNESESERTESREDSYSSDSLPYQAEPSKTPRSEYSSGSSDEATSSSSTSQDMRLRRSKVPSLKRGHGGHSVATPKVKPISRLKQMKDKLGFIFHHHHHHHHHHHDEDEKKPTKSMWKNMHSMVLRKPKEKAAAKKSSRETHGTKSKSVVKKQKENQQGGNLHSLIDGFLKHVRNKKKKSSEPLKEIRRPKKKMKVQWWKAAVKHHEGFASKKPKVQAVKGEIKAERFC